MISYNEKDDRQNEYITRKEFEKELYNIHENLKVLNDHVVKSNGLHERVLEKILELKDLTVGDSTRSLYTRIELLEKKDLTHTQKDLHQAQTLKIFLFIASGIIGLLVSLEPITKSISHILKMHNG